MDTLETYHKKRGNDPINNDTERNLNPYLTGFEDLMQALKAHFAENGIHHDKQTNSYESALAHINRQCRGIVKTLPIGTETPTNFPLCNAGPVLGTKFPNIMPIAMARKIHTARNRSKRPRFLKAESFFCGESDGLACFSMSLGVEGVWAAAPNGVSFSVIFKRRDGPDSIDGD